MGYDGAGGYTRSRNFSADASANIRILASAMDQEIDYCVMDRTLLPQISLWVDFGSSMQVPPKALTIT